jgi:hypothetical protein
MKLQRLSTHHNMSQFKRECEIHIEYFMLKQKQQFKIIMCGYTDDGAQLLQRSVNKTEFWLCITTTRTSSTKVNTVTFR